MPELRCHLINKSDAFSTFKRLEWNQAGIDGRSYQWLNVLHRGGGKARHEFESPIQVHTRDLPVDFCFQTCAYALWLRSVI